MNLETTNSTNTQNTLSNTDLQAILESLLFTLARPVSLQELSQVFKTEKVISATIKEALLELNKKYQEKSFGIELQEVAGGYQLKTKEENKYYIRRLLKGRLFKLSASALEVLVIVAYKQPCKKATIDDVRGVESGYLLKTLIDKNLVCLGPKSTDPGRPITYKTTAQFLEVFGIKNLKDLPSSNDIKDLLSSETEVIEQPIQKNILPANDSDIVKEKQIINNELEWVGEEIKSVKAKQPQYFKKDL